MENKKRKQYLFDSSVKMSPRTYYRNISKTKKARFAPQIDIEPLGIPTIQDNIESIDIQSNIIQSIDDQTSVNRSSENQSSDNQFGDIQDNFSFFQPIRFFWGGWGPGVKFFLILCKFCNPSIAWIT